MSDDEDNIVIDALKEIANISAGHLSEIISQLKEKEMSISVPSADLINVNNAAINIGASGASILVGYTSVLGDITGSIIFLLTKEDAIKLTELTLGEDISPTFFPSAMEKEALSEIIAITGGAYLAAITQLLGIYLIPNYPIVSTFEAIKLMEFIKDQDSSDEDYEKRDIIGVSINYTVEDTDIKGNILMLIGPNIMDGIEKKINEGPF